MLHQHKCRAQSYCSAAWTVSLWALSQANSELSMHGVEHFGYLQTVPVSSRAANSPDQFVRKAIALESSLARLPPSRFLHRLSKAGFHPGDVPQLCQRLSHLAHLGCICFVLAGCQCQHRCSRLHVALIPPNRCWGRAQQATCTGGFVLGFEEQTKEGEQKAVKLLH